MPAAGSQLRRAALHADGADRRLYQGRLRLISWQTPSRDSAWNGPEMATELIANWIPGPEMALAAGVALIQFPPPPLTG
jgi:hypothetical protein